MLLEGGLVIPHPDNKYSVLHLFRSDGEHLWDSGNDLFMADLQRGLNDVLSSEQVGC